MNDLLDAEGELHHRHTNVENRTRLTFARTQNLRRDPA